MDHRRHYLGSKLFGKLATVASTNTPSSWTTEYCIDTVVGAVVGPPNCGIIEYATKGFTDVFANFPNLRQGNFKPA